MIQVHLTRCGPPSLQLTMAPLRQIVHVLKQFWPCHHTGCRIWCHKVGASALGESANLLAHIDTDASKLILKLSAVLQVFGKASLLALGALHKRGLLIPCLNLTMPPLRQVVHVLKKLRPSHHTGCRVWGHKVGASALREGPNLFAHVDAHSSKLVLHLRTVSTVLSQASFLTLLTLCMKTNKGGCLLRPSLKLPMTPLRQVVHVFEQFGPSHNSWCRVRGNKVGASALWEGANLLAHINANSGQLILQVCTVFQVLSGARGCLTHEPCRCQRCPRGEQEASDNCIALHIECSLSTTALLAIRHFGG